MAYLSQSRWQCGIDLEELFLLSSTLKQSSPSIEYFGIDKRIVTHILKQICCDKIALVEIWNYHVWHNTTFLEKYWEAAQNSRLKATWWKARWFLPRKPWVNWKVNVSVNIWTGLNITETNRDDGHYLCNLSMISIKGINLVYSPFEFFFHSHLICFYPWTHR